MDIQSLTASHCVNLLFPHHTGEISEQLDRFSQRKQHQQEGGQTDHLTSELIPDSSTLKYFRPSICVTYRAEAGVKDQCRTGDD